MAANNSEALFVILGDKALNIRGRGNHAEVSMDVVLPAESVGCTLYMIEDEAAQGKRSRPTRLDRLRAWIGIAPRARFIPIGQIRLRNNGKEKHHLTGQSLKA